MTVCAVSTSWRSGVIHDARELIETMKETGLNSLELEFRISPDTFEDIKKNYSAWGVNIISLHAVCPSPPGRIRGAEQFLINDEDEERRAQGVNHVKQTIQNAVEVGAKAIVLHCGRLSVEEPIDIMKKFYDEDKINSEEAKAALKKMSQTGTNNKDKSFHALLKSLEEINREADKYDIKVGLENRYYFNEFPSLEELKFIFSRFEGSKLAYWHDTGHAHVNEVLFGVSQEMMLKTFQNQLIGVHFHDVINGYFDHNEPGCGEVDFNMVKSYLTTDTIRVMELNQRVSKGNAAKGVAFLRNRGIFEE